MPTWSEIETEISRLRKVLLVARSNLRALAARGSITAAEARELAQMGADLEQSIAELDTQSRDAPSAAEVTEIVEVKQQTRSLVNEIDQLMRSLSI